jgi:hypothetical protein
MADFKKLRRNLPLPPTAAEASANLSAPETAPMDGRSARSTGRTKQLATRVHEEFYDELKLYAAKHRLKLVEVLERGHEALKASQKDSG